MADSRSELLQRINAFRLACNSPALLDDPTNLDLDLSAKLFRNGLAVLCFSTIETFIRDRTAEVLAAIDSRLINFSELPEGIQQAATMGAVRALSFRAGLEDKSTRHQFIIDHARKISSFGDTGYSFSDLSFGQDKSNLSSDEIAKILEAFRIESPWPKLKLVAGSVGFGGAASYEQEFRNIAHRRHSAAHTMTSQVTQTDLISAVTSISAIAISFDLILSDCLLKMVNRDPAYLNSQTKYAFNPIGLKIASIKKISNEWKFYLPGKTRAKETSTDLELLFRTALQYTKSNKFVLVEYAENQLPIRWDYGF